MKIETNAPLGIAGAREGKGREKVRAYKRLLLPASGVEGFSRSLSFGLWVVNASRENGVNSQGWKVPSFFLFLSSSSLLFGCLFELIALVNTQCYSRPKASCGFWCRDTLDILGSGLIRRISFRKSWREETPWSSWPPEAASLCGDPPFPVFPNPSFWIFLFFPQPLLINLFINIAISFLL